jgi:hypothetical protein
LLAALGLFPSPTASAIEHERSIHNPVRAKRQAAPGRSRPLTLVVTGRHAMSRTYEYQGFTVEVGVESAFVWRPNAPAAKRGGFVATVRIFQADKSIAVFSPLRFGDLRNRPFDTEADALMGGYSAARKVIEDLLRANSH